MNEATNTDRARWAKNALAVFTDETCQGDHPDKMHRHDLECAIADLITGLLHLADECKFWPEGIVDLATTHFQAETDEEPTEFAQTRPYQPLLL